MLIYNQGHMNYKLAKELKDARFPKDAFLLGEDIETTSFIPTLEELIEACAIDSSPILFQSKEKWYASDWGGTGFGDLWIDDHLYCLCEGATPTEAVARLWIALNKKTK